MKPHINIGTIGHIDHGRTTLTAAICATLATRPEPILVNPKSDDLREIMIESKAVEYTHAPVIAEHRPRQNSMMAMMAMIGGLGGMPGMSARNPSQQERNSPNREKTPEDLERMEAAQKKRDRKSTKP